MASLQGALRLLERFQISQAAPQPRKISDHDLARRIAFLLSKVFIYDKGTEEDAAAIERMAEISGVDTVRGWVQTLVQAHEDRKAEEHAKWEIRRSGGPVIDVFRGC